MSRAPGFRYHQRIAGSGELDANPIDPPQRPPRSAHRGEARSSGAARQMVERAPLCRSSSFQAAGSSEGRAGGTNMFNQCLTGRRDHGQRFTSALSAVYPQLIRGHLDVYFLPWLPVAGGGANTGGPRGHRRVPGRELGSRLWRHERMCQKRRGRVRLCGPTVWAGSN